MRKRRETQHIPGVEVTPGEGQCAYTSPTLGPCRYWGTISRGGPRYCRAHVATAGAGAEAIVEASLRWRRTRWDLARGRMVYEDTRETADGLAGEAEARAAARRAGVPESLPPRERCLAIARRLGPTRMSMGGPNLAHMHALLDAAEAGIRFRPTALSDSEIAAARRATGRIGERVPGEDDA